MLAPDYTPMLLNQISEQRRKLGAQSPKAFGQIYLAHHFLQAFSPMHLEMFNQLKAITCDRKGRYAVAAPRGHAKSTLVSLTYVLWCVLYGREQMVLLVSATEGQAKALLSHVKEELEKNTMLLADFPQLSLRRPKPWRGEVIQLPGVVGGAGGQGPMIRAYGAGQSLRGARHGSERPGLIVVDDLEDQEHVIQEEQRTKTADWFSRTLLHAGHPDTNVVVVGTVLHHQSLLAELVNPRSGRGWHGVKYQAVLHHSDRPDLWDQWARIFRGQAEFDGSSGPGCADRFYQANQQVMLQGTEVLWPEREPYQELMIMREREGTAAFQAEKQNEPLDPATCVFKTENITFWSDTYRDVEHLLAELGSRVKIFGACDPSLGGKHGDYSAIVLLAYDSRSKQSYVIAADLARRSPTQTAERIEHYARMYRIQAFGFESNGFQRVAIEGLQQRLRRASRRSVRTVAIESRTNKKQRILSLEPEITQGKMQLNRSHQLLLEQLIAYPNASHDDGPDALEMALHTADKGGHYCEVREWLI